MSTLQWGAQHWKEASHWCTGQPKAHVFQAVHMEETWVDSQFLGRLKIGSQKTFIPKWSLWLFGWGFKISALRQSALLLQIPKVQDDVVLRWPRFLDYSGSPKAVGWPGSFWLPISPVGTSFIRLPKIPSSCGWSPRTGGSRTVALSGEPRRHPQRFTIRIYDSTMCNHLKTTLFFWFWVFVFASLRNRPSHGLSRVYSILYTAVDWSLAQLNVQPATPLVFCPRKLPWNCFFHRFHPSIEMASRSRLRIFHFKNP